MCFDSEMLFLACFGLGCQGTLIPDLYGKQMKVALPEFWSSWTSLQALTDVEDPAPSWAGLVSSQPGPFLHHHHGSCCGSESVIVALWRDCAPFSEEVVHFQKMWPLERLSLLSRGSKLCAFVVLPFLELHHHLYTPIKHTNYSKYVSTYTEAAKKEQLRDYLAWLQHL